MVVDKTRVAFRLSVNVSVASIYGEPRFGSEVVTQALMGEELEVLEEEPEWFKVRQWDGYVGWIHEFFGARVTEEHLSAVESDQTVIVGDLFGYVYEGNSRSFPVIRDLVYGDSLVSLEIRDGWRRVLLPDGKMGWTDTQPMNECSGDMREFLVGEARRFLGVQYLWGGKSPKGFDCSGFVQTVMKHCIPLPRDAHMQASYAELEDIGLGEVEKGDLIFFAKNGGRIDHVAISVGKDEFIHCSGFVRMGTFDINSRLSRDRFERRIVLAKSIERCCR